MLLTHEFLPAAELTGFARAALADLDTNQFRLRSFLPDLETDDIFYSIELGSTAGLTKAGEYRAWDTEAPITSRAGLRKAMGEIPPISRKIPLAEYAQLMQRRQEERVTSLIQRDTITLVRETAARVELARADALVHGKVRLRELGVEVDFGRRTEMSPTAGTPWDQPGATPLSDLIAWAEDYARINGAAPSVLLASRRAMGLLLRNEEIRGAIYGGQVNSAPSFVSHSQLDTALNAFGLPSLSTYDAQMEVDGKAHQVLPASRVLMLPDSDLGHTLWGPTLEAMSSDYGIEDGAEPGIVVGTYRQQDPLNLWTRSNAVSLPILGRPNAAFSATVLE
ncbi:major capsid protein [Nocardiopsis exhalans]|uniref:Major capsid protein n=1 Tax=Nocardiopsis exhalans TaxID=163604 RepID=A0ABY5DBM6_9ACTN|nr:major capsid protein [Nocardiopsis exhalans]USY21754.1 major capsid protein [Nocardiopsis exhalans]